MTARDWDTFIYALIFGGGLLFAFYYFTNLAFKAGGWNAVWRHLWLSVLEVLFGWLE